MAKYQFKNTATGDSVDFEGTPPFDAANVSGLNGTYQVRQVTDWAPQTVTVVPSNSPRVEYDFLSASPLVNLGAGGSANDLVLGGGATANQTDGLVLPNQNYTTPTNHVLQSGADFTFFIDFTLDSLGVDSGINLLSTTHGAGENTNGTIATFMQNGDLFLFPATTGDTALPAFTPVVGTPYKIAMTYEWNTREFIAYVDGTEIGRYTRGEQITVGPDINIGELDDLAGFRLIGKVRAVAIYDRLLSASEVAAL